MNVSRYLFQSPYSSQVQVGRPDPSVKQEEESARVSTQANVDVTTATNQTLQDAQVFQTSQVSEVEPTVEPAVESSQLLDVYA